MLGQGFFTQFPCNMLTRDSTDEAEPCHPVSGASKQQYLPFFASHWSPGEVKERGNPDTSLVLAKVRAIRLIFLVRFSWLIDVHVRYA